MPTGYTWPIEEGEITTAREFAAKAARGMGVFIHQREDSNDAVLRYPEKPDNSYYAKSLVEDEAKLAEWRAMSENDKYRLWSEYVEDGEARERESHEEFALKNARYDKVERELDALVVPERLKSFVDFMKDQIKTSRPYPVRPFVAESFYDWCEWHEDMLLRHVTYSSEHLHDGWDRYYENVAYIDAMVRTFGFEVEESD